MVYKVEPEVGEFLHYNPPTALLLHSAVMIYSSFLVSFCLAGLGIAYPDFIDEELSNRQYQLDLDVRTFGQLGHHTRSQALRRRGWRPKSGSSKISSVKSESQGDTNSDQSLRERPAKPDHTKDHPKPKPKTRNVPESPWANSNPPKSTDSRPSVDKPSIPLHKANARLGPGPYKPDYSTHDGWPPRSPFADLPPLERASSTGSGQTTMPPLHKANAKFGPPYDF